MTRAFVSQFLAVLTVCLFGLGAFAPAPALAQGFGALARLVAQDSAIVARNGGVTLTLGLSQPVPFRVYSLADPMRVVLDFREVMFDDWPGDLALPDGVATMQAGPARDAGWSRLVLGLSRPMVPDQAAMTVDDATGRATVTLRLVPASEPTFLAGAGAPAGVDPPMTVLPAVPDDPNDGRITVVLDPGHGGVDPGALRGDHAEADLVLGFARELRDALRRTGRVEVVLTRDADMFVPLPTRVTLARAAGADLFISIHADALAEGRAQGASIYTLSDTASDAAAQALAEQHDRADLLQGIDLHGADDIVAGVLMDLARLDTAPRSVGFAQSVIEALDVAGLQLHSHPLGEAGFTVLRAADIPSVLLEIGFLSDDRDLANILDAEWRGSMQSALVAAILAWADADAARRALARQ